MNELAEQFLCAHFVRQREIHARSVHATSQLAQLNLELILRTGLNSLELRRMNQIVNEEQIQHIKQLVGMVDNGADSDAEADVNAADG